MSGILLLLAITVVLVALGIAQRSAHRSRLANIPVRIHVNGTRGKSSVTRLIAAALREAGVITCAKTTGTLPRMILPDGKEYPVFRPSRPSVLEQIRIVRAAVGFRAQALVIECMALVPYLQWLCESELVRATHGVITNAREDHLDVMGPTEEDVACALAGMTPVRGKLFTAERRHLDVLRRAADDRGTTLVAVGAEQVAGISEADMAGFAYTEHAENVALALAVCQDLGLERQSALAGMWKSAPDPGALTDCELDFFGRRIWFVNGFAANDPESTERIWNLTIDRFRGARRRIAVFNCRADRPDRSLQLGRACVHWRPADYYVLIGSGTYLFARAADAAGMDMQRVVFAENRRVEEIFETILELAGPTALVMGMGNIGGPGLEVVRFFRNRGARGRSAGGGGVALELLSVSIGLGLAVSLLFSEVFGLAAGGMVVPGYVALSLSRPLDVVLTLCAGIGTYFFVHMLSMTTVIYGKRRTVIMILVGYVIGMSIGALSVGMPLEPTPQNLSQSSGAAVIGYIIPGLIGIWIDRQGLIETISVLLTAAVVVRLMLILIYGTELLA